MKKFLFVVGILFFLISTGPAVSAATRNEYSSANQTIDWITDTWTYTTGEGYTLEYSITFSPWITSAQEDVLQQAYTEMTGNDTFPSWGSFGITDTYYTIYDGKGWQDTSQVAFCIGKLTIQNTTPDYNITSANNFTPGSYLNVSFQDTDNAYQMDKKIRVQFCYSSGYDTKYAEGYGSFWIGAKMKSNTWSVPIVIAVPQEVTPENPDGNPTPANLRHVAISLPADESHQTYIPLYGDEITDESASGVPNAANEVFTYAQPFFEDVAWVRYKDGNDTVTALVNREQDIIFSTTEDVTAMRDCIDGYVVYRIENGYKDTTPTYVVMDSSGKEICRVVNSDESDLLTVVGVSNGELITIEERRGMTEAVCYAQKRKIDGTLITEFACADEGNIKGLGEETGGRILDIGEGWIACPDNNDYYDGSPTRYYYMNFDLQKTLYGNFPIEPFSNGKIYTCSTRRNNSGASLLSCYGTDMESSELVQHGNSKMTYTENSTYWLAPKESGTTVTYTDFTAQNILLEINDYPDNSKKGTPFHDGYAFLEISGADNKKYLTLIDINGDIQFDPIVYENYYEDIINRYFFLEGEDYRWYLVDVAGNTVHNVSGDFGNYKASSLIIKSVGDDCIVWTINNDDATKKIYAISKAVAAGDEVYDLGYLSAKEKAKAEY